MGREGGKGEEEGERREEKDEKKRMREGQREEMMVQSTKIEEKSKRGKAFGKASCGPTELV